MTYCSWSGNGRYLLSAARDWKCVVWDLKDGTRLRTITLDGPIWSADFHPADQYYTALTGVSVNHSVVYVSLCPFWNQIPYLLTCMRLPQSGIFSPQPCLLCQPQSTMLLKLRSPPNTLWSPSLTALDHISTRVLARDISTS